MSLIWKDSAIKVVENTVRDENGKVLLKKCHPTISHIRAESRHITVFNQLTVGDVLQRLKYRKMLLNSVLTKK
jgi:hypothetical protein